jgi:TctA family transporter
MHVTERQTAHMLIQRKNGSQRTFRKESSSPAVAGALAGVAGAVVPGGASAGVVPVAADSVQACIVTKM